jgi:glycosyltransferase involved in cell wall biosynthesis
MRPLSIVHALPFFDPATRFGGPVAQLRRVCRELAGRGHHVSVVTTDLEIGSALPRDQWVQRDGYRVWYASTHRLGRWAPYYAPRIREPLDACLPETDVLHLSLSFTHLNVVARRRAAAHGVPYVYTPRSCLDPVRLRQRYALKLGFLALHERRIIRDAAAVHVLTDVERGQVLRQGASPEQCVVIPNGAELDADAALPKGNLLRQHARVDPDAPLVLFMGRLHRVKGLDLLVEAFARLRADVPAAQLVIAGPDEGERSAIESRARRLGIADAVRLTGRLDGDLRLSAYRAADVFALTSYSEGMPNAVLEACAAGTPVLISDRCNLPEVATHSAGRVVTIGDGAVDAIACELREMLADPAALQAMGDNAQRMVRDQFSWPIVIDRLDTLYRRLTAGGVASDGLDVATVRAA